MAYAETTAAVANSMTVNAALMSALDRLTRCEEIARTIRARIHGAIPTADGKGGGPAPDHANWMANDLNSRLDALTNNLQEIELSF